MITLQTLENTSLTTIVDAFNLAFSDYIVPFSITVESLESKMKNDDLKLAYSVGAFKNGKLIAFILHGYDTIEGQPVLYNGGTGVIPTERGQQLTAQLYAFIAPILRAQNIQRVVLEVITTNKPAIATYEKIGFKTLRTLNCYQGTIETKATNTADDIRPLQEYDWQKLKPFWDWTPSWQNQCRAVESNREATIAWGAYDDIGLAGYLIYNPTTKRIPQFAVAKGSRHQGLAQSLFDKVSREYATDVAIINVDSAAKTTISFLEQLGLQPTVAQYEMEWVL